MGFHSAAAAPMPAAFAEAIQYLRVGVIDSLGWFPWVLSGDG